MVNLIRDQAAMVSDFDRYEVSHDDENQLHESQWTFRYAHHVN